METDMETVVTGPLALSHWKRVVVLMQTDFQECRLEEEFTCHAVLLITKVERYYYGIGLADVVCKVVTDILNFGLTASIDFHNVLHGFWSVTALGPPPLRPNYSSS